MSHRNAPLTPQGRLLLCRRIEAGTPIAHVAAAMGISRRCASKWWHRYLELGVDGLHDRSSRPRRSPAKTPPKVEDKICRRLRLDKVGPDRLAIRLELPASTIYRVLARNDLNRLDRIDRATATPIRRYERSRPGELVHVDVKKLGRMPDGGGHRIHGRDKTRKPRGKYARTGYTYLHTCIDDYSRLAYTEALADETGVKHKYCRPYRPQTNGKVERFHRTMLEEWAYARP